MRLCTRDYCVQLCVGDVVLMCERVCVRSWERTSNADRRLDWTVAGQEKCRLGGSAGWTGQERGGRVPRGCTFFSPSRVPPFGLGFQAAAFG
jgi:hypothetical protein